MNNTPLHKSIVIAFSKGDQKAFDLIYERYATGLYKRLLYVLKDPDEAEEILQNVFLKLWSTKENLDADKNLGVYLFKIAHSSAIDLIRRNIRTQRVQENLWYRDNGIEHSVEELYLDREEWKIIESAIDNLPPQRKIIFTLCKLEGKSYEEVSEQLAISPSTISNQLVLAMKSIKKFAHQYNRELKAFFIFFL